MSIQLSIITVNYNGFCDTCALIDSISFDESMEVIVVDNASSQDEATSIQEKYPQVKVVRSEKNLGFAGGNNFGIKASTGKYIFLVNNDTIFKHYNVQTLIDRLESSPRIGVVCPKIRFAWKDNPIQFAGYTPLSQITVRNKSLGFGEEDHGQYNAPHSTPYAHGAAMMIKKAVIDEVGLMPECFFLYYEELDWSMMITRAGYEIWYEPSCTIFHKESQTTGQNSPLRTYYITRNRLLLVKRNWKGITKYLSYFYLIFLVASRNIIRNLVRGNYAHIKSISKGLHDFCNSKFSVINSQLS